MNIKQIEAWFKKLKSLPLEEQALLIDKGLKELLISDFYLFAKYALGYVDLEWDVHHEAVRCLSSDAKRKIVILPRGSFKSSLGSVAYPMWRLERDPNLTILLDSELYTNSKNLLREIKGHYASERYMRLLGNRIGPKWDEGEIILNNRTKVRKEASITVGGIGTTKVGQHYDCLHPETLVMTSNGFKPVKNLRPKIRVLTSSGRFESIKAIASKWSDKRMIGVTSAYQAKTNWVTEDHKLYVWRGHALQWIEAKDLNHNDMLAVPIPSGHTRQVSKVNSNINRLLAKKDIWRLIGYWLAEGCRTKTETNAVRLCFRHDEPWIQDVIEIVEVNLGVPCRVSKRTKSNTRIVRFSHKDMREILEKFGTCAHDKHLPPMALNAHFSDQIEMLKGYWRGDGSQAGSVIGMGSVSHDLLSGFQLLLARFNVPSSIVKTKNAGFGSINGNKVSMHREAFSLTSTSPTLKLMLDLQPALQQRPSRSFFIPGFWIVGIKRIESKPYNGLVYDIEVANCHDFYSPGAIMHNCIIGDDYNSQDNSDQPEKCEKVINHFKYNLNILNPGGEYLIIATRYAERDVPGYLFSDVLDEKYLAEGILKRGSPKVDEREQELFGGL